MNVGKKLRLFVLTLSQTELVRFCFGAGLIPGHSDLEQFHWDPGCYFSFMTLTLGSTWTMRCCMVQDFFSCHTPYNRFFQSSSRLNCRKLIRLLVCNDEFYDCSIKPLLLL